MAKQNPNLKLPPNADAGGSFIPSANAPAAPAEEPVDRPDLRADLEADFASLKNKESMLNAKKISSKNKIKDNKLETLRKVFGMMEEAGIDPNNPDSIMGFITELERSDPDLVILFEEALMGLTPEDQTDLEQMGGSSLPTKDLSDISGLPQAAAEAGAGVPMPGEVPPVPTGTEGDAAGLANRFGGIRDQLSV